MKLLFLGTGTSGGVPALGCQCAVCKSKDPHDHRFRSAVLVESETTRVLIDCGPDIRMQLLPLPFKPLNAVFITHIHYDHVGGLDDLRPFCVFGDINIYSSKQTLKGLRRSMPYCFTPHLYPGVPKLALHEIGPHHMLHVGDIDFMPIEVMHDKLPVLGFRIGKLAYITDMKTIKDSEMPYLDGVETLVVNALRWKREHHSHMLVDEAIAFSRRVGAKRTYFTHLTHEIGFHDEANRRLPEGFKLAYDGLELKW